MDKLVLIDGNSLLNRAFYATPVFATSDGQPTNAIFGFTKLLLKIIADEKPQYIVVAFDLKAPTFRHKMYDGYKATRSPMPEELASQVKPLKSLLAAMKIAICEKEGLEADDLIGTLSKKFDVHSFIYTGDRDSFQLVDDKTDVYYTKRGVSDLLKLSSENFYSEIGLEPRQIIDLKALMGDKSDNIPGIVGVGETTARKLIEKYSNLDGVFAHIEDISSPALKKKLIEGESQARLSYTLATIDTHCPIDLSLEDCRVPASYSEEVRQMLLGFEFKSLINSFKFVSDGSAHTERAVQYPENIDLFSADECKKVFENGGKYFIDFRQDGAKVFFGGVQYTVHYGAADLFSAFYFEDFVRALAPIFAKKDNTVVLYDYKNFLHRAHKIIGSISCNVEDLAVINYLAGYFDESKSVEELCVSHGYDVAFSAFAMSKIFEELAITLEKDGLGALYRDIEKPLIGVLFEMEDAGVKVDVKQIESFGSVYSKKILELSEKIYEICGTRFNINSPAQLGEVLFEKLGLKSGKKNKTGKYSTNAETLEALAGESEAVRLILSYRQYQKLFSTYVEGIKPLIDRKTNLVHTTYNQTVTVTGRLSSANPNLQNIPIREDEGRELRKVFIPREGRVLIDADYSQIELRLLAHFSGCKELIKAYADDEDVHAVTASQVFGVSLNEVTPQMRRQAKAVNFGIIYGISEFGLSKNIGTDVKTARNYIAAYFERYTAVKDYMQANVDFARAHGYVATLSGRKRYIREINSQNYNLRQFGERAAMNMPLQGSSADIIKIAMVNINAALKSNNLQTKLIMQVHDELILDAPFEEADLAERILVNEMENAVQLKVPLKVEAHRGNNWYEAK